MNENKENSDEKGFNTDIPKSIHTLESDLASAIQDKNYGKNIIKIITDPNKKTKIEENPLSNNVFSTFNKKNIFYVFITLMIIILISLTAFYLYSQKNKTTLVEGDQNISTTTVDVLLNKQNILKPEIIRSSDFSQLNRFEIITEIKKTKESLTNKNIKSFNVIEIETKVDVIKFLEKIRYSGNESFIRSLDPNQYSFGLYSTNNENFETYLLIKIDNFDLSFKSILDWEKNMNNDLRDIFINKNNKVQSVVSTTTSATSSTTSIKYIKQNTQFFTDKLLKNYDIREYVNNEIDLNIIYGFINNKYLLITSGESSFIDIKDRILKENIVR